MDVYVGACLASLLDIFSINSVVGVGNSLPDIFQKLDFWGRDQHQRVRIYHLLPVGHVFLVIWEEEYDTSRTR
jgi:hypothetical protein